MKWPRWLSIITVEERRALDRIETLESGILGAFFKGLLVSALLFAVAFLAGALGTVLVYGTAGMDRPIKDTFFVGFPVGLAAIAGAVAPFVFWIFVGRRLLARWLSRRTR